MMTDTFTFPEHLVIQHAIIVLILSLKMLISGPSFSFLADPSTSAALQLLILLTIIISTIIFRQQKKDFNYQNGKRISCFLGGNLVFQILITILGVSHFLSSLDTQNLFHPAIPFFINISLCTFVWVWCFPDPSLRNDWPLAIYIFLALILYFLDLSFRYIIQVSTINFSSLLLSLLTFISILFILAGLLVILFKHRKNWLAGILFAVFSIIGLSTIFFNLSLPANLSHLLIFELTAYQFLPFLPGSINPIIHPNHKFVSPFNEDMLVEWLKLIRTQTQGDTIIASDFLNALRLTFSADEAVLVGSLKMHQAPAMIAMTAGDLKKPPIQIKEESLNLFESWLKQNKKGLILNQEDAIPLEFDSLLRTIGFERPFNLLFYPVPSSTNFDKKFSLIFFSKVFQWNKHHLHCLDTAKSELKKVLQVIDSGTKSENDAQDDLSNINKFSSLIHHSENYTGTVKEPDAEKISRLESELKLALEEYDRVLKLLEEQIKKSSVNWK